jgi:hypothetical protein
MKYLAEIFLPLTAIRKRREELELGISPLYEDERAIENALTLAKESPRLWAHLETFARERERREEMLYLWHLMAGGYAGSDSWMRTTEMPSGEMKAWSIADEKEEDEPRCASIDEEAAELLAVRALMRIDEWNRRAFCATYPPILKYTANGAPETAGLVCFPLHPMATMRFLSKWRKSGHASGTFLLTLSALVKKLGRGGAEPDFAREWAASVLEYLPMETYFERMKADSERTAKTFLELFGVEGLPPGDSSARAERLHFLTLYSTWGLVHSVHEDPFAESWKRGEDYPYPISLRLCSHLHEAIADALGLYFSRIGRD